MKKEKYINETETLFYKQYNGDNVKSYNGHYL